MRKLYFEMTRREKVDFNCRMVARWISEKLGTVMLPFIDGSYRVLDCEDKWARLDIVKLCDFLGVKWTGTKHLHDVLKDAGYNAESVVGGIVIVC